ncbi:hypothetical protein KR50_32570 [Jeotgalibacillus campisalis]|uniref:Uncharacterized protein n=1 Tax=Jeotgalibacillus campisalis TaxID=220754 RepID=A0A0C2V3X2_9BACL|nr:hypothetical protein KR50_32570 [Jeotgalibacillus campisalis]
MNTANWSHRLALAVRKENLLEQKTARSMTGQHLSATSAF